MDSTVLVFSMAVNFILSGVVIILFMGANSAHREVRMVKKFASAMIEYSSEKLNVPVKELASDFNKYMEEKIKEEIGG